MSYVARLEYRGFIKDFGSFSDSISCAEFIRTDKTIIIVNYLLNRLDYQLGFLHYYEPFYIKVFDKSQGRYCDGFDF